MDPPQAEGKESKLFFVDESEEEGKYCHVPKRLRRLPVMVMGVVVPVVMRVIMMVMTRVMPVGSAVCPISHVEQQYDHAVPNNGQGRDVHDLIDEKENRNDRERRNEVKKGEDA